MAPMKPLIVITGPTASGKSRLALELAERYHGEIICADSRTVYRGMDIGTAKPTVADRQRVPHHLLDIVEPGERFTAGEFQAQAKKSIEQIRARGNVPFLVGGTGLYIDSVVLNYRFNDSPVDEVVRQELESKSIEELQMLIKKHHIPLPRNSSNKRHLIRAWEQQGINEERQEKPDSNTYVVSITTNEDDLEQKIRTRAQEMFAAGVVDEAKRLGEIHGWESEAMTGNIYPILHQVLDGLMTQDEAIECFVTRDRQLVKRQLTWLRRHDYVQWLRLSEADKFISGILDES